MRACWRNALLLPAVLLTLTGCGTVDTRVAVPLAETLQNTPVEPPAPSPSERTATLRREVHKRLDAQNYQSALKLLRKEIKGGLSEAVLAEEYGRAINGLLDNAEQHENNGLPDKAGELFRCAHDGFPKTEVTAKNVRSTSAEILIRIETCATELMERGLVAYRAGDLDQAISTWEKVHVFHPQHQASQKALETARIQRTNLEKVSAR